MRREFTFVVLLACAWGGFAGLASPNLMVETVDVKLAGETFKVLAREPQLTRPDCQTCHTADFDRTKTTHTEIQLRHASSQGMACNTCHQPSEVWHLKNPNNQQKIAINHSYLACQGCHPMQAKDWAGGAHGKRMKNWQGERVIYNCTQCHNPHNPVFPKRWPVTHSTLPEHP